jgi:hypothetical protein
MKQETRKEISFEELVEFFRSTLERMPDKRTGKNISHSMVDMGLSAFSVFFMQSESFLAHQRAMETGEGCNNASSIFKIGKMPSDNHIRDMLDEVSPQALFPAFDKVFDALRGTKHIEKFRFLNNQLLMPLDGTQYFSSNNLHCSKCSTRKHKNGEVTYSHTAITPVLVHPAHRRVISLPPEFIVPQDGNEKQDCESVAAKRWLKGTGAKYAELGVTILGDDLYSRQPLCKTVLEQKFNFIFVCKPESHISLYKDYIDADIKIETIEVRRSNNSRGKRDTVVYRFLNGVPLCDEKNALRVNWCEITIINDEGKKTYRNSFVTNHVITVNNVADIVLAGRTRWKIENENNNTLKNHGYHLEHNFGHGKKHLSSLLMTMNLLAFLFHTTLEFADKKYRILREHITKRTKFFDYIRVIADVLFFKSWDDLINFMMKKCGLALSNTS